MLLPITLLLASVHSVVSQLAVSDGKLSVISSEDGISSLQTEFASSSPSPAPITVLAKGDVLKLTFTATSANEPIQPHQAMVQFLPTNIDERMQGRDYLAVVKVRKGGKGKWDAEISRTSTSLLSLSSTGEITATLLIGHFGLAPLSIPLGTFKLSPSLILPFPFPADSTLPKAWEIERYSRMPELTWTFREAEKKVNTLISTGGTLVVLAPWIILTTFIGHIKPSLQSPTLNILSFLLCLFSFEVLVVAYWTSLRLLPTLPYFGALFALTAFTGKKALGDMRKRRVLRQSVAEDKKLQ